MARETVDIHLRIPRSIAEAVESYARRRGVKRNGAACVLITRQLEAEGEIPRPNHQAT